jgi:hypothetical protein
MSGAVTRYVLQRGERFLSAHGWQAAATHAMRFRSEVDARASLADMRRTDPKLMSGEIAVVPLQWREPAAVAAHVAEYDPFGMQR